MAIKYNPYGWKIRPRDKSPAEIMIHKKEEIRDKMIRTLCRHKDNINHEDIMYLIKAIYYEQSEINEIYENNGVSDNHPHIDLMEN